MVWHYPPTKRQLAATACFSLTGVALIVVGAHLSYANVAPQQARAQARREFLRDYFRKKFGD